MTAPEYTGTINLDESDATDRFLTCDLTTEYVRINADYSPRRSAPEFWLSFSVQQTAPSFHLRNAAC